MPVKCLDTCLINCRIMVCKICLYIAFGDEVKHFKLHNLRFVKWVSMIKKTFLIFDFVLEYKLKACSLVLNPKKKEDMQALKLSY